MCTQGPRRGPHCLWCRRIFPTAPSLPAWAHAAQEPNLVSSPLGKTALGSTSALDSSQSRGNDLAIGKIREETEHVTSGLLIACSLGPGHLLCIPLSPPASCKGHPGCGREGRSCALRERCGSHWDGLPAVLSSLFPLAQDPLHPRMKSSKLGKVSSPLLQRIGHGILSWPMRCKRMSV